MCTSEPAVLLRRRDRGFTVVELLVGLTLALLLALGTAPMVLSLQAVGVAEGDRTVGALQGRVAAARLERDLRLASAGDSPFCCEGPILEASASQVVFLGHAYAADSTVLIEWEVAGTSLMRRWGPCPTQRPSTFTHSLYTDSKTMVSGLAPGARLSYKLCGQLSSSVAEQDLWRVESVSLQGGGRDEQGSWPWLLSAEGRVGM